MDVGGPEGLSCTGSLQKGTLGLSQMTSLETAIVVVANLVGHSVRAILQLRLAPHSVTAKNRSGIHFESSTFNWVGASPQFDILKAKPGPRQYREF